MHTIRGESMLISDHSNATSSVQHTIGLKQNHTAQWTQNIWTCICTCNLTLPKVVRGKKKILQIKEQLWIQSFGKNDAGFIYTIN